MSFLHLYQDQVPAIMVVLAFAAVVLSFVAYGVGQAIACAIPARHPSRRTRRVARRAYRR